MFILSKIASHTPERFSIAKEGVPVILFTAAIAIASWIGVVLVNSQIVLWGAVLLTIITGGVVFLFRNPHRITPALADLDIVSPADGKIISIGPARESEFLKRDVLRISIFLSLIDVHVNWLPVSGVVKYKKGTDGKCLPAYLDSASNKNKRVSIGIECDDGFCMTVVQITGLVARRIKCHLNVGQNVNRGDRYGMICFGSRVDVFVPRETSLIVRKGDRVCGGITVIGQKCRSHGKNKNFSS